ncbi:MAG: hypothetical protein EA350_03470 [Gemmatimonadales bacterium]|nr:MAG: hypothetical protein EA350_03470 [Gemmatimonadales bacterium]
MTPEQEVPPSRPPLAAPDAGAIVPTSLGADPSAVQLLDHLVEVGGPSLRTLGFRTRLQALGRAGERFLDPGDPLRQEAEARLPADADLKERRVRQVIEGMARDWTAERLAGAVRADFPDPDVLDGFRPGIRGERIRVVPPRLLVQVGAGNVPGTGATALLRGLLVGAPTLLKPGTGDTVLPELLARAIREESPELAEGLAVVNWTGGEGSERERMALARAERVVVYGGEEAVVGVRASIGPLTPLVVYGPRVSAGLVLRDASGSDAAIGHAAAAVAAYAQRGCVSPHLVWVQEGGARTPEEWAEALALALAAEVAGDEPGDEPGAGAGTVRSRGSGGPAGEAANSASLETRGRMRALRDAAEFSAASGSGDRVFGGPGRGWMVLYEPAHPDGGARPFEPSCLGRTVRVRPLPDPERLGEVLEPVRHLIQGVAVEGSEPGRTTTAMILARSGVTRVTTFRDQPWPPAWWKHDGGGPLRALVRWATLEPAAPE